MKILILKQGVIDQVTLDKGLALTKQWASTIGLDLEFSQVETTKQFTSIQSFQSSVSVPGWLPNGTEIFQEGLSKGVADIYCLVYDWTKITPQPTNPSESGRAISIPIQWYVTYPEVFAEFFLHELSHYFLQGSGQPDLTHNYDPRYSQLPRKDWYLFLIKPFVNQKSALTLPTVTITRKSDDRIQTLGILKSQDFQCFSLERPWKNNKPFISCIPKGTYTCKWTFSPKFLRYTYEIQNVQNRSGIRIHSANFYSQLLGCIALGNSYRDINYDGKMDVLNSRITVAKFEQLMDKKDFTLVIS